MHREDYRATLIVMLGVGAAVLTGFLREAALAHQLGAGRATDIYLVAFTVPEFVFIALPIVLSPAFIPLFAAHRLRVSEAGAWRFGLNVAGALLALSLGVAALVTLGAPIYLRSLAPGFSHVERKQAAQAVYVMWPAIVLMGQATLAGAILQVYRRFARPALATAAYNLTFVVVLLGIPLPWPVGRAAWGVTLGAAMALAIHLPLLWRHCPASLAAHRGAEQEPLLFGVADMARLAAPLAAGYAVHHAILFVDRAMATTLASGSVAALNYGYRLALVVGQLSGLAVSTALFPRMVEQAACEDTAGMKSSLAGALRFVLMVGLPATCGLLILRTPLVRLLFEHGAFEPAATAAVSDVLRWYALAVFADALCQPLWRVLYAWRSTGSVLFVNSLQTGIRFLANVALISTFGYNGLALSAALGLATQVLLLAWLVRRRLGGYLTRGWWQSVSHIVLASGAALVVVALLVGRLSAAPALVSLSVSGTSGGLTYLLILQFLEKRGS